MGTSIFNLFLYAREHTKKSTCIYRSYSALIVFPDQTVIYGYSHSPRSYPNCKKENRCIRKEFQERCSCQAEFFEECQVIHAEMDVLIKANIERIDANTHFYLLGVDNPSGEIYKDAFPCNICKKMIIEAGFKSVYIFQSPYEVVNFSVKKG